MQPDKKRLFKALVREGLEVSYDQTSHVYTIRGVGDSNSPPAEVLLHESLPLEAKAVKQLANLASAHHPHGGHVCRACATPDFHPGDSGVAIGSVVETADILIPQAVGTDINCGMRLHTTDLTLDRFLGGKAQLVEKMKGDYLLGTRNLPLKSHQVRAMLEEGIPSWLESMVGPRGGQLENIDLNQLWLETNRVFELGSMRGDASLLPDLLTTERDPGLGTIGRGNHFVEIQVVDEILDKQLAWEWGVRQGAVCYMIHSGSRDVGKHLGSIWETRAREDWPREFPHPASGIFPIRVGTELARRYLEAEATAANYAFVNRLLLAEMMRIRMREVFGAVEAPLVYDIPHNITLREGDRYVARKGACPARAGVPVIVPGSMGTESFLLVGLGNDRHISSASHGAGRAKSRGSMGRLVKDDAHMKALGLTGIECITLREERRVEEAPAAYKPIRPVIDVQVEAGIVAPVAKLKPILTFKS